MKNSNTTNPLSLIIIFLQFLSYTTSANNEHQSTSSTILFSSVGRPAYDFDIYTLPIPFPNKTPPKELLLTDGTSVNFNGHFPTPSNSLSTQFTNQSHQPLIYVSERDGSPYIYLDLASGNTVRLVKMRASEGHDFMQDRPSLVGNKLIYVSTHEDPGQARASWAAVYSTDLGTGMHGQIQAKASQKRLTPKGVTDYSPATSPSGEWTAVASLGEKGWGGQITGLDTEIYVFKTEDGSGRVKVVPGGWPSRADEKTLYY